MRFAGLCLLVATRAFAEPSDMREFASGNDDIRLVRADELGVRAKLDVVAAGLAKSGSNQQLGAIATVTAHVGITTTGKCELVGGGGLVTARSDEKLVSASQWASVCLAWDDSGYTSLDHRLDWDLTPRLLATPRFRPGPQRRETVGWDFIGSTIPWNETPTNEERYAEHLQQGTIRMQTAVGWVDGDPRKDVHFTLGAMLRTYIRTYTDGDPPLSISVIGIGLDVLGVTRDDDDPLVGGFTFEVGRIDGLRIGQGFRVGARFGGFVGTMMRGSEMTARNEFAPIAEGTLSIERTLLRGVVLRLAGDRKSYPVWDARLAIDNRATSTLAIERGDLKASLAVAWGLTELRAINDREYVATGGVTAEANYALSKYVDARARSEVGRSIYVLDSAGEPRWASETLIMLALHTK